MDSIKFIAPRSEGFVDWTEAYGRVEAYFCSLRIQNKLLLSQLVANILGRAAKRLASSDERRPAVLAMQEAHRVVEEWFVEVLTTAGVEVDNQSPKGRLSLFLADMPRRWQNEFLQTGPWPDEFLKAMRSTYLKTGPDFQKARMTPREIDLGPVSAMADETWRAIDRWPVLGAVLVWGIYLGVVGLIIYLLR